MTGKNEEKRKRSNMAGQYINISPSLPSPQPKVKNLQEANQ